jgi:hypothetical protein
MKRILLRAPKSPFDVVSPEETLDRNLVGTNSGNLIFLEAAWKQLATRDTVVVPDRLKVRPRLADEINERYDAYVLPLANAFRFSYEPTLIRMTQLIERLRIPVIVLGVGAQLNIRGEAAGLRPIEPSVRAFVSAVLDRSASIGVRGELTAAYLNGLGFRDVEVIGCPSMFLHGERLRVDKRVDRLERGSPVSINVSPYVKAMGDIVMSHVERYPNLRYIAQDLHSLQLLLWGESRAAAAETSTIPIHTSHPLFRDNKVRYYVDPWPWIRDLRSVDFSFGTRIHGNIAAILAGTPAYVFAHDSRTLELARYFGIPHRTIWETTPDIDAADLYDEADYGALNEGHAERFARFRGYLERHGLRHVFEEGEDATAFDRRIAETPFPPAIVPSAASRGHRGFAAGLRRVRYRAREVARAKPVRKLRAAILRRAVGGARRRG